MSEVWWHTGVITLCFWELTGGIKHDGQLTACGTSDWAWTVPVHLPAGILFFVGLDVVGLLFVFAGLLVAGFAAAELLPGVPSSPSSRRLSVAAVVVPRGLDMGSGDVIGELGVPVDRGLLIAGGSLNVDFRQRSRNVIVPVGLS